LSQYSKDTSHIPEASLPHIRVIQIHPETFEETSLDAVMIRDYERNQPCDYRLDFIGDEGLFFIIGPKDIIKAMPRSFDDRKINLKKFFFFKLFY